MALSLRRARMAWNLVRKTWELSNLNQSFLGSSFQSQKHVHTSTHQFFEKPFPVYSNLRRFLSTDRFITSQAQERDRNDDTHETQVLDFPGGVVTFTPEISFISESSGRRTNCYRVLDDNGNQIKGSNFQEVDKEVAVKMYNNMVILQIMDTIFYEAQRQGRISFYLTTSGEEAINIASAAALCTDDVIFAQYREPGVLLWRGFTLQEFANQCFGNKADYGKGRQMPIHYGSKEHNYFTVSSPIATQIPHAVGAAYSLKIDKKQACAVTYFGDGATSEGDFHGALNFAAVMEAPILFFCRNNGWAISTPTSEQFRSDGVVVKGQGYGVRSIRVDGNDALAVYHTVRKAREIAIKESRPILIEALTYRAGHHSTSDDSTKYRPVGEIEHWRTMRDPISRFRKWLDEEGWWSNSAESELRNDVRKKILNAIQVAEKVEKPPLADMFTDVYHKTPPHLQEQERLVRHMVHKHPQDYPSDILNAIQVAEKVEKPPLADMFTDVYHKTPPHLQEQERLVRHMVHKHPQDYPSDVPV